MQPVPNLPFDPDQHTFRSPVLADIVEEAVRFFVETPVQPFPPQSSFYGPGVYALYYVGSQGVYTRLGARNQASVDIPIYVGQVSAVGIRKGQIEEKYDTNTRLLDRLKEHARSIRQVNDSVNLNLEDFRCRFVILLGTEAGLSRVIETELIRQYRPLWNTYIDGFGIHDPGGGRLEQAHSEWDSIHPGRRFLGKMRGTALPATPIYEKLEKVLAEFEKTEEDG